MYLMQRWWKNKDGLKKTVLTNLFLQLCQRKTRKRKLKEETCRFLKVVLKSSSQRRKSTRRLNTQKTTIKPNQLIPRDGFQNGKDLDSRRLQRRRESISEVPKEMHKWTQMLLLGTKTKVLLIKKQLLLKLVAKTKEESD